MTITTINHALHTVHVEPLTGQAVMVMPHPADDLHVTGRSLHESAWSAAFRTLREVSGTDWEPTECDETGLWLVMGTRPDGREVISLCAQESIISNPSIPEMAAASTALSEAAGLLPARGQGSV